MQTKTTIIAEVGSTHENIVTQMHESIDAATSAGANVVKFQWVSSAIRLAERRRALDYREAYEKIVFPKELHKELHRHCVNKNVLYGCTVYLPEDIDTIVEYADVIKVSSFEAGDLPFLLQILFAAKTENIPVVISLGGRDQSQAVSIYRAVWSRFSQFTEYWPKITFLHCISAYPCKIEDLQLHCLHDTQCVHGLQHAGAPKERIYRGLSDHTLLVMTGSWAVMAGATVLEKHIRGEQTPTTNADYAVSMRIPEFSEYVGLVRLAEQARGSMNDGRYVTESEHAFQKYQLPLNLEAL